MKTHKTLVSYKFLLVGLSFACMAGAMEPELPGGYEGNTYKGDLISADTLAQLAEQYTPMPECMKDKLQQWLEAEVVIPEDTEVCFQDIKEEAGEQIIKQNQDLVAYLAQLPDDLSKARAKSECNQKVLKIIGASHTVHQSRNYIFEPTEGTVLRIAGTPNRLYSIISGQDRGDKWLDPYGKEGEAFIKNPESRKDLIVMPTYHTISMYANYLLLKKFIEHNKLKHVITPDTYLEHIPGRPEEVSDDNYMVIQKKINGTLINLLADPSGWEKLSDKTIKELFVAARVGLWNINGNLLVDENGNCVLLDLEQPNNSDPRAFFNKPMAQEWGAIRGRGGYARYIVDGIELIAQMMEKAQEKYPSVAAQLALWKLLIQQNDNLLSHLNQGQQERLDNLGK